MGFIKKYAGLIFILFLINLLVPDPIPIIDEVILGALSAYGFFSRG